MKNVCKCIITQIIAINKYTKRKGGSKMTLERAYLLYYIFNITTTIENNEIINHKQLVK